MMFYCFAFFVAANKVGNSSGMDESGTNKSEETTQTNYIAGNNQNFVVVIKNNIKKTEI